MTSLVRKTSSPNDQMSLEHDKQHENKQIYAQSTCSTYQASKTCTKPNTKHLIMMKDYLVSF